MADENYRDRIKYAMRIRGLTQAQFADMVGIQQSAVSMLLSGARKPELGTIIKICNALNISIDWLYQDELTTKQPSMTTNSALVDAFNLADDRDKEAIKLILSKYSDKFED